MSGQRRFQAPHLLHRLLSVEYGTANSSPPLPHPEKMRKDNPELFEHVWLGQPLTANTGSVFGKQLAQAREDGRIGSVPYDDALGCYTAWDLGIGIGVFAGGHIAEVTNYTTAYRTGLCVSAVGCLIFYFIIRQHFERNKLR